MTTPRKKLMLAMAAALAICLGARAASNDWMVVDLRTGAVSYQDYDLTTATNTFNTAEYKTEKMAFRHVPQGWYWIKNGTAGAFMSQDYYIAIFPVTVGQYALLLDKTADIDKTDEENWMPKTSVTWQSWYGDDDVGETLGYSASFLEDHALDRLTRLIESHDRSGLDGLHHPDFPTAAMWEVAARAMPPGDGSHKTWPWFFGETFDDIDRYAWRKKNGVSVKKPVGMLEPNAWGLYDVYGNVGEWCLDGVGDPYDNSGTHLKYSQLPGQETSEDRVHRLYCGSGGDCDGAETMNSSYVNTADKTVEYPFIGTRIAIGCSNTGISPGFTVTWSNSHKGLYDVIETDTDVSFGEMPSYDGPTPTPGPSDEYVYEFAGWTPEPGPVASNITYTTVWNSSAREYTIRFWDLGEGWNLLCITNVPFGEKPVYFGPTPTKPPTEQSEFVFSGKWEYNRNAYDGSDMPRVRADRDFTAVFTAIPRQYPITWANYDGTVLCVTNVPYGATPAYNGATPTKPPTVTSQFVFSGWTETVVPVTGAATYTAAYAETPRPYPVTWLNYDGTVLCVTNIPYGEIPAYLGATPKKESAYRCHYDFSGWTPELAAVTEAGATYTATFNEVVDLLAHLTFDDYGNGGTNVLKATVGEDGIVRTTQTNVVEGLGEVTPVTDASILAGLPEGDGAVAIPLGTHIALPIPAALASESGKPWSISMKVKFPSLGSWYCLLNMPASNSSDAMVYLSNSQTPVICLKQSGNSRVDGSDGFTAGQWETLLFLFDSGRTRVLLNGKEIFNNSCTLAGSRADCANAGGYILLAGDENDDDSFMYWADVRVYDGIVDDTRGWDHATVTWRNYDGTLLDTEEVSCGVTPVYKGAKPSKPTSLPSYFDFSGWTEEVVPVTGDVTYTAKYTENTLPQGNTWMVVDLPTGDATYFGGNLGDATNAFNTSEFKTTKMVFRRVPEGFYWCRGGAHVSSVEQAIMGRPYYIGMFPVTEAQYALMLDPTATVTPNATNLRPQANVSYSDLRGSAEVPSAFGEGLADGPIYRLNAHVQDALGTFDLPTVAMWEVASRAMPSGDDSHKDWQYTFDVSSYDNLYKYAWFYGTMNVDDGYGNMTGRRVVGTKLPNDWGLYDMPGNVWDWCLDNYSDKISRSQTPRKTSGNVQLMGGSYTQNYDRNYVYSQAEKSPTTTDENVGFRLAMISDELPTYTITWRDYDGTVLATDKFAQSLEGVTPTYSGRFLKKPGHYFTGWSPAVATVDADAVYTATYQSLESGQSLVDLSTLAANYTAQDGDVLIDKTTYAVSIADGATVTLAEMSSPGLTCLGNATIIIADNTENTLSDTLRAGGTNTTLTIQGNTGTLTANGGLYNAGIGGKGQACGNIRIEGGIINATGGFNAAGIGPYYNNNHVLPCGDITITGGTITAVGNGFAAGIGASDTAPCGKILISGGFVTATGGSAGPGIGGPTAFSDSVCESITISGGTVYATGFATSRYNYCAIGWNCGDIRIDATIAKVVATVAGGTPIVSQKGTVTIAEGLQERNLNLDGRNTRMIGPDLTANITWQDGDGTVLCTTKAPYASTPVYPDTPPTNTLPSHVFAGWSPRPAAVFDDVTYTATYSTELTWMVVDLRTGATSYYGYDLIDATNVFNTVEYKTEKMVFRRVPEGRYYVRNGAAVATMERPYYVGMFPVTVAQYNLMIDPSAVVSETAENLRAIVNVSYATLRGSENVPTAFGGGLGDGPISRLNTRVTAKLGPFDLPTESMWEVAARAIEAGAETNKTWPWFFGASDSQLSQYAFFNESSEADAYGLTSGSRVPGGKLPNAWGLFDIYGNVWERCLDSCPGGQSSETMSLSQVPQSGYPYIRQLGGSFANGSDRCRTSDGGGWQDVTQTGERSGFRLALICTDDAEIQQGTQIFINGESVDFERSEDGKTITATVPEETPAEEVPVKVAGVDVSRGFSRKVEGTVFTATLLAPYEVPKEAGAADGIWTENGDGTVTLNVTVVPGLYYAADSAESLDALACPGASAPATVETTFTAPKPIGEKGFFKVWVSDAPIPATP